MGADIKKHNLTLSLSLTKVFRFLGTIFKIIRTRNLKAKPNKPQNANLTQDHITLLSVESISQPFAQIGTGSFFLVHTSTYPRSWHQKQICEPCPSILIS